MSNLDSNKEEGEISDDDDVKLIGFSKNGEICSNSEILPTTGQDLKTSNDIRFERQRRNSKRVGFASRQDDGWRRPGMGRYGLSQSLAMARELVKNYQPKPRIPNLMSIDTSRASKCNSGLSHLSPASTNNGVLLANIPLPCTPAPSSVPSAPFAPLSVQKSQNLPLAKLAEKALFRKKGPKMNQNNLYDSFANSPSSDMDEIDYVDMLLEYKEIQKQLDVINREEGHLVEEEKDKENLQEAVPNGESEEPTDPSDFRDVESAKLTEAEEDDDLEILELRRRCLESLAAVTGDKTLERGTSIVQKCRPRLSSYRRNKSPVGRRQSFQGLRELGSGTILRRPKRVTSPRRGESYSQMSDVRNRKRLRKDSLDEKQRKPERFGIEFRPKHPKMDSEEEFRKFMQSWGTQGGTENAKKKKVPTATLR